MYQTLPIDLSWKPGDLNTFLPTILSLIFFVIILSMTNENLSNELPSTLYPSIPHTGLDGISLNSYVAGSASL